MKYHRGLMLRVLLALFLAIFYKLYYVVFKPLTLHLSFLFLKIFDNSAILIGDTIRAATHSLTFIDACVAASAYLLLTLLILLTKDISPFNRFAMFVYGSILILGFNLVRIEILFYSLFNFDYNFFQAIHMVFWKFLSTIYVFLVWLFLIKKFKVKSIPVYSDFRFLLDSIRRKKK